MVLEALEGVELEPGFSAAGILSVIEECAAKFEMNAPGHDLGALDPLIPAEDSFVGTPAR